MKFTIEVGQRVRVPHRVLKVITFAQLYVLVEDNLGKSGLEIE